MVLAVKPVSLGGKRKHSRWYDDRLRETARRCGAVPLVGPLYARIIWFQPYPEPGDVDNMVKRILDALKGLVFQDDDQIAQSLVQKAIISAREFELDLPSLPSEDLRVDLPQLLVTGGHVLYIEIGPFTNRRVFFGSPR